MSTPCVRAPSAPPAGLVVSATTTNASVTVTWEISSDLACDPTLQYVLAVEGPCPNGTVIFISMTALFNASAATVASVLSDQPWLEEGEYTAVVYALTACT